MKNSALKKITSEPTKTNNLKLIRSPRFDHVISSLEIKVFINEKPLEVVNISESGLAFVTDPHDSPTQQTFNKIKLISIRGNKTIYEGAAEIVWRKEDSKNIIHGLVFKSGLLGQDFVKALEHTNLVALEVENNFQNYLSIPSEFKLLVYEIKHYLSNLKIKIDEIEKTLEIQSPATKKSYIEALGVQMIPNIISILKNYNLKLNKFLVLLQDKNAKKTILEFFRKELNSFYLLGPYSNRAMQKPLGYAGDYEMMNQLYRNDLEGLSLFGQIMHKYGISEFAGDSVRFRKNYLKNKISEFSKNHNEFIVASIACGPAKEIVDFINEVDVEELKKYKFILIDQDLEALLDARRSIYTALMKRQASCEILCMPLSVKDILEGADTWKDLTNNIDFIYTAGLYDYLTQPVAKMVTLELFNKLNSNGKLIIGNFHPRNPSQAICEFAVDWRLIHRNEEEMLELLPTSEKVKKTLLFDEQEIDIFLLINKE